MRSCVHSSLGTLDYSLSDGYYRLVVSVDPELHRYYRSRIPKSFVCNPQRYPPHITVVRGEVPPLKDLWGRYQGRQVCFDYSPEIRNDETYWWLNCYAQVLTDIRLELGLPASYHLTRPPSGEECFHTTIGNRKTLDPAKK